MAEGKTFSAIWQFDRDSRGRCVCGSHLGPLQPHPRLIPPSIPPLQRGAETPKHWGRVTRRRSLEGKLMSRPYWWPRRMSFWEISTPPPSPPQSIGEGRLVAENRSVGRGFDRFCGHEECRFGTESGRLPVDFGQTARLWDFFGNRKCFFHRKPGRDSCMGVGKLHLELGVV